jgi:hypothetical protein
VGKIVREIGMPLFPQPFLGESNFNKPSSQPSAANGVKANSNDMPTRSRFAALTVLAYWHLADNRGRQLMSVVGGKADIVQDGRSKYAILRQPDLCRVHSFHLALSNRRAVIPSLVGSHNYQFWNGINTARKFESIAANT